MVSTLLDPREPKNVSDGIVLVILALQIVLAYVLPAEFKKPVLAAVFIFWRASYNVGIGLLLRAQSNHNLMVTWAKRWKLFVNPATGDNPRPRLYHFLKHELEAKIPQDYKFQDAPLEYNTWLVFRRLVDLILMCDFVSYCLFAIVCARVPEAETALVAVCRWAAGLVLFVFNIWVKLDAHRVVKDYAWYWGDFFYLIDQELTFDGVFECAPHPMYSIGYAGYYGVSCIAASYEVLFISIAAHLAQLAFLVVVENPYVNGAVNLCVEANMQHLDTLKRRTILLPRGHARIPQLGRKALGTVSTMSLGKPCRLSTTCSAMLIYSARQTTL